MGLNQGALDSLKETSRTFFIPISLLPDGLQDAFGSAYLCMRAIDEIEDHPTLSNSIKAALLRRISLIVQGQAATGHMDAKLFQDAYGPSEKILPGVTLRLGEWMSAAPAPIAPRIWDATAAMAERMAHWASVGWKISNEADLNRYTFGVAGAVGVLLCDLWAWFRGEQYDRAHAIEFGRGLQSVNILRNRADDLARGVDFFPEGWTATEMDRYARRNLDAAGAYARTVPEGAFKYFLKIPQALAYATLEGLARGQAKLSRAAVLEIVQQHSQVPPM